MTTVHAFPTRVIHPEFFEQSCIANARNASVSLPELHYRVQDLCGDEFPFALQPLTIRAVKQADSFTIVRPLDNGNDFGFNKKYNSTRLSSCFHFPIFFLLFRGENESLMQNMFDISIILILVKRCFIS